MNTAATVTPTDPVRLVAALSGDEIRRRLDELDTERRALIVLLRSVQARERACRRKAVQHGR